MLGVIYSTPLTPGAMFRFFQVTVRLKRSHPRPDDIRYKAATHEPCATVKSLRNIMDVKRASKGRRRSATVPGSLDVNLPSTSSIRSAKNEHAVSELQRAIAQSKTNS